VFIEATDDGSGGDNWSYKWCKASVDAVKLAELSNNSSE